MGATKLLLNILLPLALSLALASVSQAKTHPTNSILKKSYHQIIEAYASLEPSIMTKAYTDDGYYVSTGKKHNIAHGAKELSALYQHYFTKIKKNNFKLAIEFKVIDRLIDTKSITDVGYYLVTVSPALDHEHPIKQHAGKYLMTFKQDVNNQWRIWSDANNRVSVKTYHDAVMLNDLFYASNLEQLTQPSQQCSVAKDLVANNAN